MIRNVRHWVVAIGLIAASLIGPACGGGGGGGEDGSQLTTVPSLFGLSLSEARARLTASGLVIGTVMTQPEVTDPAVLVLAQDPVSTTSVARGSSVTLTVSLPDDAGKFLVPDLFAGSGGSATAASSYYLAIDPTGAASTLSKWKALNRFGQPGGKEAFAVYQNDMDLGFGRRMSMRREGSRVAFYVENFGSLENAVDEVGLVATVAMEYSPGPAGADPNASYTKFYVFGADGNRITKINLDGEGEKYVPDLCLSCHGGRPGNAKSGIYPKFGDVNAQFIPFDLASFKFSRRPGLGQADQEDQYKLFNEAIRETHARTFSYAGPPVAIPDNDSNGVDIPVDVAELERLVNFLDVTFDGGGIEHASISDLEVTLVSPTGQRVRLLSRTPFAGWEATLAQEIPFVADEANRGMEFDAGGDLLVVTWESGGDGRVRRIDTSTGETTTVTQGGNLAAPTFPSDLGIAPNGDIFVVESTAGIVRVDPNTGQQTVIPAGLVPANIVVAADGFLLVRDGATIHRVHPTTGARTIYAQGDKLNAPQELALDANGNLFVADSVAQTVIRIDATTQAQSYVAPVDSFTIPTRVAIDSKGRLIVGGNDGVFLLDPGTGATTKLSDAAFPYSAVDSGDVVYFIKPSDDELMRVGPFDVADLKLAVLEDAADAGLRGADAGRAPFPGSFRPFDALSAFRNANPNGRWVLNVKDLSAGDSGRIVDFALHFSDNAKAPPHPHPVDIIEGWYGGRAMPGNFDASFLPAGWSPPNAPVDADELYLEVVARSCRLCHMQMDRWLDFSTYDGFMALGARHQQTVYDEGVMPLSKRTFAKFWMSEFPPNQPTNPPSDIAFVRDASEANGAHPSQSRILAKFLASHFGNPTRATQGPGRPRADAGNDLSVDTLAPVELNGTASLFAGSFQWEQVDGPTVNLIAATTALPRFTAPNFNTELVFRLTVRNASGVLSSQATVKVNVEAAGTPVANLSYLTDIHPIWAAENCTGCHQAGINALVLTGTAAATYAEVVKVPRVNKADPATSLILTKPTNTVFHGGGPRFAATSTAYQKILKWIEQGAKNDG